VPSLPDKQRLLELLYEACSAPTEEKAAAYLALHTEIDRVRAGTVYSRHQVKDLLYQSGFHEYAKRRKLSERNSL
jgi:hypothetical protein